MSYRDRDDPGNDHKYHTGKRCIESGCERPAGTAWSKLWCFEHNVERMDRISAALEAARATLTLADGREG